MKKTNAIKSIVAAALSLMSAGCAKEQLADNAQQAGVSFTVEVPGRVLYIYSLDPIMIGSILMI